MASARHEQLLNQLGPLLDSIAAYDPNVLVQKERLGAELSFEPVHGIFVEIVSSIGKLRAINLGAAPFPLLNQLLQGIQGLHKNFEQVANFSSAAQNAVQLRDSIITNIENNWGSAYLVVRAFLGSERHEDESKKEMDGLTIQLRNVIEKSSETLAVLETKANEADGKLKTFIDERTSAFEKMGAEKISLVDSALEEVRRAAAEAGVSQTSTHFAQEASEHAQSSVGWLWATATTGAALLMFSLFGTSLMSWAGVPEPALDAKDMVYFRYFAQKGLVVFCLFFALLWCARNFSAAKHNYVVNKHRSNALASFQAFATSASDEQTKSAVLVQATQSVFSPQPSGYIKSDGDNSPVSPIVEVLRSATSAKDK
jgi:hypothetical protein